MPALFLTHQEWLGSLFPMATIRGTYLLMAPSCLLSQTGSVFWSTREADSLLCLRRVGRDLRWLNYRRETEAPACKVRLLQ